MRRIKKTPRTSLLEWKKIIVTGCWYKPVNHIFYDSIDKKPTHDELQILMNASAMIPMKVNIGTAVAAVLARNGADVVMSWHTQEKIDKIKKWLLTQLSPTINIEGVWLDILDEESVKKFVSWLPTNRPISRVQSIGLWAGNYQLKDDNPYLPFEHMDVNLIESEMTTVVRWTHLMMKELLPILKKQQESRIVMISSMSAIRWYELWSSHCTAKAAIDKYANVAMLKFYKDNIRISTVRPGAVDTGMYDSPMTRNAIREISAEHNGVWKTDKDIVLMPPTAVGEMIKSVLTSQAHIAEINMVSKSQFPHQGS